MGEGLKIDCLGGNCPVQAEGTIDGVPFYFRARHRHWGMGIGGEPVCEPQWYRERPYGIGEFDAGYMPLEDAERFIRACAADFLAGRAP